ncbi:MAG: sulfatase-like hydrolase/transferase [Phycisphaera sp.]|nr:sulfatase-like hydrolase/transferase [Phycisphaera sp.]
MADRPNILVCISDDQSYPHTSAYGYAALKTPGFDRVAEMGVLFSGAFTPSPGCSPMRGAFLTGRNIWQIEEAGTHASSFQAKYKTFQEMLEDAGYFVGFTGKGWAPGNWKVSGRTRNPAGDDYGSKKLKSPGGISNTDYAANFVDFLDKRPKGKPFSFWYGGHEPHRSFKKGIGRENGMDPSKVVVPPYLPDTPEVRDDLLDYCYEIQWFDSHLVRMLDELKKRGELDNTLIIVTSDNGMSFPYAKANTTEFGIHMPLTVAWPAKAPGGRKVDDLVNLIDLTATIYDVSGVAPPKEFPIAGRSIMNILASDKEGVVDPSRDAVFSGRERHSSSRYNSLGYPQRSIRTPQYLYIRNFRPERWPAGTPQKYATVKYDADGKPVESKLGPEHGGYHDIDACPTLDFLVKMRDDAAIGPYLHLAVDLRPGEELYDILKDPGCKNNLAADSAYSDVKDGLNNRLITYLRDTKDPRVVDKDGGDVFETYPRYSPLRWFPTPDWAKEHPERVPKQDWVDERRPK